MLRSLLILAGVMTALAPMVAAQSVTVCVFQSMKGHKVPDGGDAQGISTALGSMKLPGGRAITAITVTDVPEKDEDAAAQKRSCTFIADVWRNELSPDTPLFAGTLAPSSNIGQNAKGALVNMRSGSDNTILEYALRKTNSDKKFAHGESDDATPYVPVADQIAKKLAKEK